MSEIKRGDLVMVVRPRTCCGGITDLGITFIAGDFYTGVSHCPHCKTVVDSVKCVWVSEKYSVEIISRLIRIDPPALSDETETKKEIEHA